MFKSNITFEGGPTDLQVLAEIWSLPTYDPQDDPEE